MEGGESGKAFENPWNRGLFFTGVILFSICSFGVGLIISVAIDNIIILVLGLLLGSLAILTSWNVEYYHRPCRVIVKSHGVDLNFRLKKPIFFVWSDLIAVYADSNARSSIFTDFQGYGGSLVFRVKEPYDVSYRIASAVKEAYRTSTGTYPIEWNGYENYKRLRKRVMKSMEYRSV